MNLNDQFRESAREMISEMGLTHAAVGEKMGVGGNYVTRMLSGYAATAFPASWAKLLDVLGLEVRIVRKGT